MGFEVNRPNRQNHRRRAKSDPVEAEAKGLAVLNSEASTTLKTVTVPSRISDSSAWLEQSDEGPHRSSQPAHPPRALTTDTPDRPSLSRLAEELVVARAKQARIS